MLGKHAGGSKPGAAGNEAADSGQQRDDSNTLHSRTMHLRRELVKRTLLNGAAALACSKPVNAGTTLPLPGKVIPAQAHA